MYKSRASLIISVSGFSSPVKTTIQSFKRILVKSYLPIGIYLGLLGMNLLNSEEDIFNHGKRFWKPLHGNIIGSYRSLPLLNLVSINNYAIRGMTKKCSYKMKMNQIGVQMSGQDYPSGSSRTQSTSNHIRRKSYVELTKKKVSVEHAEKLIQVGCMNYNIRRTLVSQIVSDRTESKEISLERMSYDSSANLSEVGIKIEKYHQYLRAKYIYKWKSFVERKIVSRKTAAEQSSRDEGNDLQYERIRHRDESGRSESSNELMSERLKQQNYKKKLNEQINTAREVQLARLKLEEELFARDVEGMLKANTKPVIKSDSRSFAPNRLNKSDQKKTDVNKLRMGWDLVSRMELRAQERQRRWEDIRERKQKLEIEKAEKMRIEEERRKQAEDEEKKQRILKVKQEIKRRVMLKKMQEEERIRLNNLNMRADEHYKIHLLKSSLASLALYLKQCQISMVHAGIYYNNKLLTESLVALNLFRRIEITKKREAASEFYETSLLKRTFEAFKKIRMDYVHKTEKSKRFNKFRVIRNYFSLWFLYHVDHKCKCLEKEEFAIRHYQRSLMKRCFQNWKQLPLMHFQEREKEQRFRTWCSKIQELLPDFQPSE